MRRSIWILIIVGIPLVFSATAAATPPQHRQFVLPGDFAYSCGLTEQIVFDVRATDYFDAEGAYVYTRSEVSFDGLITNPVTGETFRDRGHQTIIFPADETAPITFTGIIFNLRRPGQGVLLLAVGRLIVSSDFTATRFSSGHNIPIEEQDAAVCAALT